MEVVFALAWAYGLEDAGDGFAESVEGALGGLAEACLEFAEEHLDGVEVGGVGRQIAQFGPGGLDGLADARDFVAAEVVGDDQVTGSQRRHQELFDPGAKDLAVHRCIEQCRSGDPVAAQSGHKCVGMPVAVGCLGEAARGAVGAAVAAGQVGRRAGFIKKDQPGGIPGRHFLAPRLALLGHVRAILLGGVQRFF